MSQSPDIDIRYTHVTDAPYLRDWLLNQEVQRWFPVSQDKEIEDAVQCWVGFSRYNSSLTSMMNVVTCGIGMLVLMSYRKVAHHCLFRRLPMAIARRKEESIGLFGFLPSIAMRRGIRALLLSTSLQKLTTTSKSRSNQKRFGSIPTALQERGGSMSIKQTLLCASRICHRGQLFLVRAKEARSRIVKRA